MDSGRAARLTQLRAEIELLKQPEFNPEDIDDDLHKRFLRAVKLSHQDVYPARIPWLSHTYPMFLQDVFPDMSVSPRGRSDGLIRGCQPGFRTSEAVES